MNKNSMETKSGGTVNDKSVMNEFVIEWLRGSKKAGITVPAGSALKSKLLKYAETYPEQVNITINKDGSVFGKIPVSFIKISPPRKVSEENAAAAGKRMAEYWEKKKDQKTSENPETEN